jgi:hypothetical protein
MGDAGDAGTARRERAPDRAVATLVAAAMAMLAGCEPQTPANRPSVDGMWSPFLAGVVRGRSASALDAPRCGSEFSGAVLDVLWARTHASPPQRAEMDTWLGQVAFPFFGQCYEHEAAAVAAMPPSWPWRRAEADYAAWLSAHSERVLAQLYAGEECRTDACVPFARRWPGFDALAAGLPVVHRWERSGHTSDREVDAVVCPRPLGDHADMRCGWFRHAMADAETTRRLAAILGRSDDPALVRAVVSNSNGMPPERVIALWRALEPWPRMWREAGVTAAETLMEEQRTETALVDEAVREYATPEHSDVALYLLTRAWSWTNARMTLASEPWERLAADHGGPVAMTLFARLLDVSPRSVTLVPAVWPGLAKGDSRVLPVLDRLDAYLNDPGASMQTLREIAGTVCQRGSKGEIAELHDWLVRRAQPGSKHLYDVESAASSTKPGHCTAPL